MAMFVVWNAATVMWTSELEGSALQAVTYVELFGMAWIIWEFGSADRWMRTILQAYVLGCFCVIAQTVLSTVERGAFHEIRLFSEGVDPNELGLTLALGIPFALIRLQQPDLLPIFRWLNCLYPVVAVSAIIGTGSRGAFVSLIIGALVTAATIRQKRLRFFFQAAAIMTALWFIIPILPETLWQRFGKVERLYSLGQLDDRRELWEAGLETFKSSPILGTGAFTFRTSINLGGKENVAHNTFVSVLVETGLIGFSIFCALCVVLLIRVLKAPSTWRRSLVLGAFACWSVAACSLTLEYKRYTWLVFSIASSVQLYSGKSPRQVTQVTIRRLRRV
jgi:O-antigen ligase